jgi:uncharacterized protein (TIGR02217 family)
MAFHEVQFPTGISYGSRGGPGFAVNVIVVDSGQEQRISRWDQARRRYDVAEGVKSHDDLSALMDFFMAREGATHGFRYKDFQDFTTAPNHRDVPSDTDVILSAGDGSETQFQLRKLYTSGVTSVSRVLTKPVVGTTVVSLDDVSQVSGWSVDITTGIITFTSPPGIGEVIKAGCEFDVPVRFANDASDHLNLRYDDFSSGSTAVELIELLDEGGIIDEFFYGGAYETVLNTAGDTNIALSNGRVQVFQSTAVGVGVRLPDFTSLPLGGPYIYIQNPSNSTQTLTIKDSVGTNLKTLAAGEVAEVLLTENNAASKEWILF